MFLLTAGLIPGRHCHGRRAAGLLVLGGRRPSLQKRVLLASLTKKGGNDGGDGESPPKRVAINHAVFQGSPTIARVAAYSSAPSPHANDAAYSPDFASAASAFTAGVEASRRPIFMATHAAREVIDIRRQGLPSAAVAPPPHGHRDEGTPSKAPAGRRPAPHLVTLEDIPPHRLEIIKEGIAEVRGIQTPRDFQLTAIHHLAYGDALRQRLRAMTEGKAEHVAALNYISPAGLLEDSK